MARAISGSVMARRKGCASLKLAAPVDIGPGRLAIGCGTGVLELLEVQRPGGRRMAAAQYQQAIQGRQGTR